MADTSYATVEELKVEVSIADTDSSVDDVLQRSLNTAAYIVDYVTRKPPRGYEAFSGSDEITRYYDDVDGAQFWWTGNLLHIGGGRLHIDDLLSVTSIVRGGYTLAASDYKLYPYNEDPKTEIILVEFRFPSDLTGYRTPQWGTGMAQIEVTGSWGYCADDDRPDVIKQATITQAARLYERRGLKAKDLANAVRDPWKAIDPLVLAMLEASGLMKCEEGGEIAV